MTFCCSCYFWVQYKSLDFSAGGLEEAPHLVSFSCRQDTGAGIPTLSGVDQSRMALHFESGGFLTIVEEGAL